MTHTTNIIRKEVKELLTPGSVASVLVMVILLASIGGLIGGEIDKSTQTPVIGIANYEDQTIVIDDREWNIYDSIKNYYIKTGKVDPEKIDEYLIKMDGSKDIYEQLANSKASCAIVLDKDFKKNIEASVKAIMAGEPGPYLMGDVHQYFVYKPTGMIRGTVSTATTQVVMAFAITELSNMLFEKAGGTSPTAIAFLKSPINSGNTHTEIKGKSFDNITPAQISSALSNQTLLIPMIIMIIIMMVGSIVISSMGSEKENKTLETLLTLPIKRTSIVTGKIIAAAIVGLVFGVAYMIGMTIYLSSITKITSGGVDLAKYGLTLGPGDLVLLTISMFLAIVCALGICMILGAFAKNYKSAQTMTMPLSILAIIPMFLTMFSGWYGSASWLQAIMFAIPFSHPMIAPDALINGDFTLVLMGIAYMAIFAIATILITVRLYNSDILVTGLGQNKYVQMLKGSGKKKKA